jgi:hypothetical protein
LVTTQDENELATILEEPYRVGTLKADTPKKLVGHLVPSLLLGDPLFVPIFLCTYRQFAATQQVLDLLFAM